MEKEEVIRKGWSTIQSNLKKDSGTMRAENQTMPGSSLSKSFSFSDKLVTGIIAVALMCLAPIIPILIAFGVGHFTRYNADKLNKENSHERNYTRRH